MLRALVDGPDSAILTFISCRGYQPNISVNSCSHLAVTARRLSARADDAGSDILEAISSKREMSRPGRSPSGLY